MKSVPITTDVVNLNPARGEVYLIKYYVIKVVSDLRQVDSFLQFPPKNKTDHHNITEILLKVALNTIILTLSPTCIITTKLIRERKLVKNKPIGETPALCIEVETHIIGVILVVRSLCMTLTTWPPWPH